MSQFDVSYKGKPLSLTLVLESPSAISVEGELEGVFDSQDVEPGSTDMLHLNLLLADVALCGNPQPYAQLKAFVADIERPGHVVMLFAPPKADNKQVEGTARPLAPTPQVVMAALPDDLPMAAQ